MQVDVLRQLLQVPGPSGDEAAAGRVWRNAAAAFADRVEVDVRGSSLAVLEGSGPRILLAGHIDEIGIMVSHIDEHGFLFFSGIGGWDVQVLVGQRIRLLGRKGEIIGVIGKQPIHLLKPEERTQASKIEDLWIDIGAQNQAEAAEQVRVGTVGVIDAPIIDLPGGRLASRSIDNRIGAFTVLEALRLLAADRPAATVAAVATSQEEITFAGAYTSAFQFAPDAAIIVDVTFATDSPNSDKRRLGDVRLGGGPVLSRGSANSPVVFEMLVAAAERESIPYAVQVNPRATGTDADAIALVRNGVACGVVSIANRYMHSPNEMIQLSDVEQAAKLIAAFVRDLTDTAMLLPE